jgi:glucose/mannose-6-phosphate isomerase
MVAIRFKERIKIVGWGVLLKELEKIDSTDMSAMVASFPLMLRASYPSDDFLSEAIKIRDEGIDGICLIGMGGSAIAGDICRSLLVDTSEIPILTVRDYIPPKSVKNRWTVIAVSYSGNTEETIAAYKESVKRGCSTFVLTAGGVLQQIAKNTLTHMVPAGFQPRAALPIIFAGILPLVETLLNKKHTDLDKTSRDLEKAATLWSSSRVNPERVAESFKQKIPLFIGWRHLIPVAYRAKCQINENSKSAAFNSEIPEMNHNEIEGAFSCAAHPLVPVFLRSSEEDERARIRFEATSSIFEADGCETVQLDLGFTTRILETLGLTLFLDQTSLKLAEIYEVDPVSVEKISQLKRRLE